MEYEHSDRAREVTEKVKLWLANDADYCETATGFARTGDLPAMGVAYAELIRTAPKGSAAWQVAQDLAPSDYDRINWTDVADELLTE